MLAAGAGCGHLPCGALLPAAWSPWCAAVALLGVGVLAGWLAVRYTRSPRARQAAAGPGPAGAWRGSRMLADHCPFGILLVDRAHRCRFLNRAMCELLDVDEPDALGRDVADVWPGLARRRVRRAVAAALSGRRTDLEIELPREPGPPTPLQGAWTPVRDGRGSVTHAVGSFADVSAAKAVERELRSARAAAERASLAKGDFLAAMSHEIRTPMNGVLGMTQLALGTELTGEQRGYLELIDEASRWLLRLIGDVLDYSRIEAGKLALEPVAFDLCECLEGALALFSLEADAKGLELVCDVAPDVPGRVVGDAVRLRQIVVNLVGNAIKFCHEGEVVLRVGADRRSDDEVHLHFRVCDTGVGIPPEKQQVIFEAFEQARHPGTPHHGGSGLGLAIASRLTGLLGGRIWVDSRPGRGSVFHFTARLGVQDAPPDPSADAEDAGLHPTRVLVVDDNEASRRALAACLTAWGMQPQCAGSADSAVETLRQAAASDRPFQAALLDACLSDADGLALIERLREGRVPAGKVVLLLPSAARTQEAQRATELGVRIHVSKPVRRGELRAALRRAVSGADGADRAPRPDASRSHPPATVPAGSRRVLVAEDDPISQKLVARLLDRAGYDVTVVPDGARALEALEAAPFDLVLMDVQMPEMNGLEATAAIRRRERDTGGHVPVLAMTGHATKGDAERCLQGGMDGHIAKPISPQRLLEAMAEALAHHGAPLQADPAGDLDYAPDPTGGGVPGRRRRQRPWQSAPPTGSRLRHSE